MSSGAYTGRRLPLLIIALIAAATSVSLLSAQSGGFRFDGPISRMITPNGDQRNDIGIICFENPSDSDVDGRIYTLMGANVATLRTTDAPLPGACPAGFNEQHMDWDPRSQGGVRSGVYVYQLKVESQTFSGTFLVVK